MIKLRKANKDEKKDFPMAVATITIGRHEAYLTKTDLDYIQYQLNKFAVHSIVERSELFVCGHPPKQTYLLDGTWHCEKCGGKWESIANK